MERLEFKRYTRKEIVDCMKECAAIATQLEPMHGNTTQFQEFRLSDALENLNKYSGILKKYPDAETFTFHNGNLVELTYKTLDV